MGTANIATVDSLQRRFSVFLKRAVGYTKMTDKEITRCIWEMLNCTIMTDREINRCIWEMLNCTIDKSGQAVLSGAVSKMNKSRLRTGFAVQCGLAFLRENRVDRVKLRSAFIKAHRYDVNVVSSFLPDAIEGLDRIKAVGTKRKPKEEIMAGLLENHVFTDVLRFTYDWRLVYGFADAFQVDLTTEVNRKNPRYIARLWSKFVSLLKACSLMKGINSATKGKMKRLLEKMPLQYRSWAYNVLMRDLRVGVGPATINKVCPTKLIPVLEVQLPQTMSKDLPEIPEKGWCEKKLDGQRLEIVVEDVTLEKGMVLSRAGREKPHLHYLVSKAAAIIRTFGSKKDGTPLWNSGVIEAEGTDRTGKSWSEASKAISSESVSEGKRGLVVRCFNFVDLSDFEAGRGTDTNLETRRFLEYGFSKLGKSRPKGMVLVKRKNIIGKTHEERKAFVERVYRAYRKQGYEGCMVKDANGEYLTGDKNRGKNGLWRIKPFDKEDVRIVGYYEGKKSIQGMLGGFVCERKSGVQIKVGGGFKKSQRIEFWKDPGQHIGKVITIEKQEDTPGIKSRHANFAGRIRPSDDK